MTKYFNKQLQPEVGVNWSNKNGGKFHSRLQVGLRIRVTKEND